MGDRIRFWDGRSVGQNVLKDSYPRLYASNLNKEVTLSQVARWNNGI